VRAVVNRLTKKHGLCSMLATCSGSSTTPSTCGPRSSIHVRNEGGRDRNQHRSHDGDRRDGAAARLLASDESFKF
jgi:hypothetical protein